MWGYLDDFVGYPPKIQVTLMSVSTLFLLKVEIHEDMLLQSWVNPRGGGTGEPREP